VMDRLIASRVRRLARSGHFDESRLARDFVSRARA
jgi:hypothetical protein